MRSVEERRTRRRSPEWYAGVASVRGKEAGEQTCSNQSTKEGRKEGRKEASKQAIGTVIAGHRLLSLEGITHFHFHFHRERTRERPFIS